MLIVPPPESEQRARAVWRDPNLRAWLREKGLEYAALRTDYVLSYYLADPERLLGTGLTTDDDLTVDHVIAYELGGVDSIYNFHLMKRSANSHFGEFYTAEKVHSFLTLTLTPTRSARPPSSREKLRWREEVVPRRSRVPLSVRTHTRARAACLRCRSRCP